MNYKIKKYKQPRSQDMANLIYIIAVEAAIIIGFMIYTFSGND